MNYRNTSYGDFSLIRRLLLDLGIRHIREGLVDTTWQEYYDRLTQLGSLGVKGIFITSPMEADSILVSFPSRVHGAFEGYEAPNEYDLSRDPQWALTLKTFTRRMYRAVKSNPATAAYPVIGPSLVRGEDFAPLAEVGPYIDFANLHNYYGGRNPGTPGWGPGGYGSIDANIKLAKDTWPGKPVITTETGYDTMAEYPGEVGDGSGTPASIEGKYIPRAVFEQVLHGITRTYFYELIDEYPALKGKEGHFGLALRDGSPKPAFTALQNLNALISDKAGPGTAFVAHDLPFSLVNGPKSLHHLLMQKRDGSYYLAFWLEDQNYDVNARLETPSKPQQVSFQSPRVFGSYELFSFAADGSVVRRKLGPAATLSLTATDCVTILRLQ